MFGKKKEKTKDNTLNFKSDNYQMQDNYNADNLVIANLEYVSNKFTPYGPMIKTTTLKYIFEIISENSKNRYREVFTGFIADVEESKYFNLPYVVNIVALKEQVPRAANSIPKYGLILVLNEINKEKNTKKLKKK